MGSGEFVGNQSVHWKIDHGTDEELYVDLDGDGIPDKPNNVKIKKCVHGCDGKRTETFTVRLRFDSAAQASERLASALKQIDAGKDGAYITVELPCLRRKKADDSPAPEVSVRW